MIYDALVAGGGLAGSAVAIDLARARRSVVLIERESGPHDKVCGEFLSFEALHYLDRLGIKPSALGAVPLHSVRLAHKTHATSARLPFRAYSLSRRVLDEALLQRAAGVGVEVRRGVRVKSIDCEPACCRAVTDQAEPIAARAAFLATGKHDLKDMKRGAGRQGDLIGFKMYWQLSATQMNELDGHVELALFPGGYAGLQPVEGGRANLCLLVRRREFSDLENSWDALLERIIASCPHLARRLAGGGALLAKPLAISSIPYGFVFDGAGQTSDKLWRLGDQAAVIPSFSGDGMSIALHSACLAASTYLEGLSPASYHHRLAGEVRRQIRRSTRVSKMLVAPWGQTSAGFLARMVPPMMTELASLTRISRHALIGSHAAE